MSMLGWPIRSLLIWFVLLGASAAQATLVYKDDESQELVTLRAVGSGVAQGGYGLGYVRCSLINHDVVPHEVRIELASTRGFDGSVESSRTLTVEPGSRQVFLPVAVPPASFAVTLVVGASKLTSRCRFDSGKTVMGMLLTERADLEPAALAVLQAMPALRGSSSQDQVVVHPDEAPTDWRFYTGYSTLLVDGRASLLPDTQEALRRCAFAGGTVVVAGTEALPPGPLRELADVASRARDGSLTMAHGLGRVVAIPALSASGSVDLQAQLGALPTLGAPLWPAANELFAIQKIPGLGEAPVGVFLLVILAFAILVGPVNFWILRKRKRPLLALLTVPLLGFGTTFVILGYGIFHDGFAVRGVVTSWSVLDQERHEVATVSARTLFAGLAPNDLSMPSDVILLSQRASLDSSRLPDYWRWDGDAQRLDGGVLPSRTVTPLVSVQQGAARDRLTFRKSGDGVEVLGDTLQCDGEVLLSDLEGRFYRGSGGRLREVDRREFALALRSWQTVARTLSGVGDSVPEQGAGFAISSLLPKTSGRRGFYLAQFQRLPWGDEHSLEIEYSKQRHYVFGRLSAEDFVR
ncbi:MAG: hypothetical protein AB8H80_08005 [Planctomycetota bacterium]